MGRGRWGGEAQVRATNSSAAGSTTMAHVRPYPRTSMVCLALALLGCKQDEGTPDTGTPDTGTSAVSDACDQAALASLAERLDSVEPEERVRVVSEGLLGACGALLPAPTALYLREVAEPSTKRQPAPIGSKDESLHKAKGLACPKLEELDLALQQVSPRDYARTTYEVCDFGRYGLIPVEEFAAHRGTGWLTWTTHALLLDAGTPPEVAGTITRAMFLFETIELGSHLITPLDGQQLPKIAGGTQIPAGIVVYASMTEMTFNDNLLAALQSGVPSAEVVERHVILPLYERLEEEAEKQRMVDPASAAEWEGRMLLAFDERVPFSTVVDTMYTGGRAGFANYAFIVQPSYPVERALLVATPRFGAPKQPRLKVFIADDGFHVALPGEDELRELPRRDPTGSAPWDQPGLAELVGVFIKANSGASMAVVSAENHIPLGVLLGTYATLAGPGCDQAKPETCLLPDLIIEAGAG
jgi:hypothetical protein